MNPDEIRRVLVKHLPPMDTDAEYERVFSALLSALETPPLAAQDGWVMVPTSATPAMISATYVLDWGNSDDEQAFAHNMWNVMLAAAPTPPSQALNAGDGEAVPFMWAIREPSGVPFFDESCVSMHADELEEHIEGMDGYEVIPLYTHPAAGRVSVSDEAFGYFCECKGADPVFLRKPAYIPPNDDLHTTTPLYAHPNVDGSLAKAIEAAEAAYPGAFWVLGKGRVHGEEKLFGFHLMFGSDEVIATGEADDAVSAIRASLSSLGGGE